MSTDNYRVIWHRNAEPPIEVGSIGVQTGAAGRAFWAWGIDTVVPVREFATHGEAPDREASMAAFREAWDRFTCDPARLALFVEWKAASAGGDHSG
ncbi:hypothetical protein LPW26_06180 [Rhodopseudomonas sp. HC1]|uniref:hypothetical protein n=1 Tax=Rhodopseudomonas infernalis TaxID=2897386 RepID=UPI001EE9357C|nr:hypothetical protein [Rhodopseudomonas infernalis]MCG6204215.1 hypothetical protein [Rhodopseudomonas infernalis]